MLLINDYTYIQLFNKNIWNTILNKIKHICNRCSKKSEKIYSNNITYIYCENCTNYLIDLQINEMVIREEYGKSKIIKNNFNFF